MDRPEVTTLYKYFSLNEYSIEALKWEAFWFAPPRDFNDPFDCGITLAGDAVEESVRHALTKFYRDADVGPALLPGDTWEVRAEDLAAYRLYQERLSDIANRIGVLCLTEKPDNLLMWSHYADKHRGFVIGLERSPDNPVGRQATPVVYQEAYPRLGAEHFDPKVNPQSADQLWLTKSAHWAYEREWRLLALEGRRHHTIGTPIRSLIFGMRMPSADRQVVRELLAGRDVKWFEARRSSDSFAIEICPLP